MIGAGDLLALVEMARNYLASKRALEDRRDLLSVREALKCLYFSDATIQRLERIPDTIQFDALNYEAGMASIRQRDTRSTVQKAFQTIQNFSGRDDISISFERQIRELITTKFGIRHEIERVYFEAIVTKTVPQTKELIQSIRSLNEMIERVDNELGGAILS